MRVIIAGGGGFIGKHLVDLLSNSVQNEILVLDNFTTSLRSDFDYLESRKNVQLVEWDVTIPYQFDCDIIFNLACPASPVQYQKNPVETARTNFLGTMHALELARANDAVMIQASTSEVYGDPKTSPQREDYWGNVNPIGIRSCYDEGKRVAETLCFDFHREYGTSIKVARIFNTYGPGMAFDDGRVVSNFISQVLRRENLSIFGQGQQTRSFCFVSDTVDALAKLSLSPAGVAGPINIGNPKEITILELAQAILEMAESNSRIEFHDLPSDDPTQRCPDISLANQILNWKPEILLDEGLRKTFDDFKSRMLPK